MLVLILNTHIPQMAHHNTFDKLEIQTKEYFRQSQATQTSALSVLAVSIEQEKDDQCHTIHRCAHESTKDEPVLSTD